MKCVVPVTHVVMALVASCALADERVVARVKVQNASGAAMTGIIVRGCLPLPRDYEKPVAALALRDGAEVLPTQVSVLSTYAGSDERYPVGRPEVVQLAAEVDLPAGGFKEFDVVEAPVRVLSEWLPAKAPVVVEAVDCFGNRYRASVLDPKGLIETRQDGHVLTEKVYQSVLTPVAAAPAGKPALSKFLRIRAYETTYAGKQYTSLALMIHNGSVEDPNGDVYYRSLRVGVGEGAAVAVWRKNFSPAAEAEPVVEDGTTWLACPPPDPGGKLFVVPDGSAAVVRMTVFAPGAEKEARQFNDFAPIFVPVPSQELFSWSNYATARYGAGKYPMPLDLGANALQAADAVVSSRMGNPTLGPDVLVYLRQNPGAPSRTLGHALPAGTSYGGKTGGDGILYVFGAEAAVTGHHDLIKLHVLLADRHWDRQRAHLFHEDGAPYTYGRRLVKDNGVTVLDEADSHFFRAKHITPADPACQVQADYVKANDLLSPQAQKLLGYMDHDDQHLCRLFDAVAAVYLACDPLDRDRLVTLAGQTCWKKNIHPLKGKTTGGWLSLYDAKRKVDAKAGAGVFFGREDGWLMHSLGLGFALSKDKQFRADCVAVAEVDADVCIRAQMPAGNVQNKPIVDKALVKSGVPADTDLPAGSYLVRCWEDAGIVADGARAVTEILSDPAHRPLADQLKQAYGGVGRWSATRGWNPKCNTPAFLVIVPGDNPAKTVPVGQPSSFNMGSTFAWYYEVTGDEMFIEKMKAMAGTKPFDLFCKQYLGNWSYSLWLAQGGKIPGREGWK